jgi:hypothetical protein
MPQQYDIFRLDKNGKEFWVEPASTLDAAKALVHELGAREPGDFFTTTAALKESSFALVSCEWTNSASIKLVKPSPLMFSAIVV